MRRDRRNAAQHSAVRHDSNHGRFGRKKPLALRKIKPSNCQATKQLAQLAAKRIDIRAPAQRACRFSKNPLETNTALGNSKQRHVPEGSNSNNRQANNTFIENEEVDASNSETIEIFLAPQEQSFQKRFRALKVQRLQ